MSKLSSRLRHVKEYSEKLQTLKMETAMQAMDDFMQTDQFKLAVMSLPSNKETITAVVQATVKAVTNPTNDFVDVLRARGFRSGEIRSIVRKLYNTYCISINEDSDEELLYEDILPIVAEYALSNPNVYASLNVEDLRNSS